MNNKYRTWTKIGTKLILIFYLIDQMYTNILRDKSGSDTDSDNENRPLKDRVNASSLLQIVQIFSKAIIGEYNQEGSHISILTGRAYVEKFLSQNTNQQRFADVFGMPQWVFLDLCEWLERGNYLKSIVNIDVKEQVATFVWTIDHNRSNWDVKERFQLSWSTLSNYVNPIIIFQVVWTNYHQLKLILNGLDISIKFLMGLWRYRQT